jgi:hypothetical protein
MPNNSWLSIGKRSELYTMIMTSMASGTLLQSDLRDKWLEAEFRPGVGEGVGESTVMVHDVVVEPLVLVQPRMAFASARRCPFVAVLVAAFAESNYDDKVTMYIPITSLQCANVEDAYMVPAWRRPFRTYPYIFCTFA